MPDDPNQPRLFDFLSRWMAWVTLKLPRFSPIYFAADANRRRANDLISEAFTVRADDGVELEAVRFPAQALRDAQPAREPPRRRPVIFCHGWSETKEFHYRLPRLLAPLGHDVILFDQRGHGHSGGKFTTLGVKEPDDLRAVLDECERRGWAPAGAVTLGVSMGGATVLQHAAQDGRVAGVAAYAPFTSFLDAIRSYHRRYARLLSAEWGIRGFKQVSRRLGFDITRAAPIEHLDQIRVPTLLVVGQRDVNLPSSDHASVLARAMGSERCQLVEVPHATHFNIVSDSWPAADAALLNLLRRAGDPI